MGNEETARTLGRIEGKVDMLIDMQKVNAADIKSLQRKVWGGIGTACFAVVAAVGQKVGVLLPLHG